MVRRLAQLAALISVIGCASRASIGDASWTTQSFTLSVPSHITGRSQSVNSSTDLTLQHTTFCTLTVSVAIAGNECLSLNGQTLITSYELTGTNLPNGGDATWIPAANFVGRSYLISTLGPVDTVTLHVKADSPAALPPETGTYSAAIIITASW